MKGDVVNLIRVFAFRLALAAFFLSVVALSIYWAGNLQEFSDTALFVAMSWAEGASIAGVALASLATLCALIAPFFSGRIALLTFLGALLVIAASLGVLALVSTLRVLTGGLAL